MDKSKTPIFDRMAEDLSQVRPEYRDEILCPLCLGRIVVARAHAEARFVSPVALKLHPDDSQTRTCWTQGTHRIWSLRRKSSSGRRSFRAAFPVARQACTGMTVQH